MKDKNEFLSRSSNEKVLAVYQFCRKTHNDDYYDIGIAGTNLLRILIPFTPNDWKDLATDFEFWTIKNLRIFVISIMNIDSGYYPETPPEILEPKAYYQVILEFFNLIIPLLQIDEKRNRRTLHFYIFDEFEFIEYYAPLLARNDITIASKLKRIIRKTHYTFQISDETLLNNPGASKAKNKKVLLLYSKIIAITNHKISRSNSKYWSRDVHKLLLIFEPKDWYDLEDDLSNWTQGQRYTLASCLLGDWTDHFTHDARSLYDSIKNW